MRYAETLVEFFGRADRRVEWAGAAITSGGRKATRRRVDKSAVITWSTVSAVCDYPAAMNR